MEFLLFIGFSGKAEQDITALAYTAETVIPLVGFPYSFRQYIPHSVWDESRGRKLGGTGKGGERGTVGDQEQKEKKGKEQNALNGSKM